MWGIFFISSFNVRFLPFNFYDYLPTMSFPFLKVGDAVRHICDAACHIYDATRHLNDAVRHQLYIAEQKK